MHKIKIIYDQDIAAHIAHNNFQIIEMHIKTGDELIPCRFKNMVRAWKDFVCKNRRKRISSLYHTWSSSSSQQLLITMKLTSN